MSVSGLSRISQKSENLNLESNGSYNQKTALERFLSEASPIEKLRDHPSKTDNHAEHTTSEISDSPLITRAFDPSLPPSDTNNPTTIGPTPDVTNPQPTTTIPAEAPTFDSQDDKPPKPQTTPAVTSDPNLPPSDTNNPSTNGPTPDNNGASPPVTPSPEEPGGGGSVSPALVGGFTLAAALRPFMSLISSIFGGLFGAAPIATVGLILYPNTAGGGRQEHSIVGTDFTIQINSDQTVGQVYGANGQPLDISVTATGVDANGNPTGFIPSSEDDAISLGVLTGTDISADSILGTTINADEVDDSTVTDGSSGTIPSTGNEELDDVLEGTVASDDGTYGLLTPQSQEEFEENLANIPGASDPVSHSGGGVEVRLEDGTTISTYGERDSTGQPGYQITSPDGDITHKGSLVGEVDIEI